MHEEILIVGAGPIGLACAISAKKRGFDPLVIDAGAIVNSIAGYPVGMGFFTTPELLEIGGYPLVCSGPKPIREEALKYYRGVVDAAGLRVRTFNSLLEATRNDSGLVCLIATPDGETELTCDRLVLATGYFDNPNPLDVPGEDLPFVSHYFDEPHPHWGRKVIVIGGKNSAAEAALELFRAGADVTIVYRRATFPSSIKYWVRPDLENRIRSGEIGARMGATVMEISNDGVRITRDDGKEEVLPADQVFALVGFRPDLDLFRRVGIEVDPVTGRPQHDPNTLETNVSGVFLAGSITAGYATSDIFIENGRFDGETIFGDRHPE